MPGSVVEIRVERRPTLNAICLKSAVLCAECDVVSDSPHDHCLVCGSRSLFNIARLLGGSLPKERAKLVEATMPAASAPSRVLTFPRPHKTERRKHRGFRQNYR
jgi:hypothetical protein